MPEVGDKVTPQLSVNPAGLDTVAALTIIKPDGTSTAGTGEVGSSGNTAWQADQVTLDTKDVWVLHWAVTGTGASVADQYIMVRPAGVGARLPAAFATIADVVARLPAGKVLTDAELQALPGKLSDATTKLRGYITKKYVATSNHSQVLRPTGNYLELPAAQVSGVDSVAAIGRDGDVPLDGWYWDGWDRIYLARPWPDELAVPWDEVAYSYRVVYDHLGVIPDFLVAKTVELALRHLLSPTPVEGMVNEKIGQYSYLMNQSTGTPGTSVKLTDDDRRELREAGFRQTAATTTMSAV